MSNNSSMSRYEANHRIIAAITVAVEKYPDQRFHQILQNLNIGHNDDSLWNKESTDTLMDMNFDIIPEFEKFRLM